MKLMNRMTLIAVLSGIATFVIAPTRINADAVSAGLDRGGPPEPRILLIGDSWAADIGNNSSFETVLSNQSFSNVGIVKEGVGGSSALQWSTNHLSKLDTITSALTDNPTIDIVHINLGGNDVLGWPGPLDTPEQLNAALETIADRVEVVVDHIHSVRPTVRVGLGSYDYVASVAFNPVSIANVPISAARAAAKDRFDFINAVGYTQFAWGFPGEFAAGEVPIPGGFPEYTPAGGGDQSLPSPPGLHDGSIHLVAASYVTYIERCFNEFYRAWLLEDQGGSAIWVDFAHRGDEFGTSELPMNDLTNALLFVNPGGTLMIKGDTADSSTPETITLDKNVRIEAVGGIVTIGGSSARSAGRERRGTGFVSKNKN